MEKLFTLKYLLSILSDKAYISVNDLHNKHHYFKGFVSDAPNHCMNCMGAVVTEIVPFYDYTANYQRTLNIRLQMKEE